MSGGDGVIRQSRHAVRRHRLQQGAAGLATDPEVPAQLPLVRPLLRGKRHERVPLIHNGTLLPQHAGLLSVRPACRTNVSEQVLPLSSVYTASNTYTQTRSNQFRLFPPVIDKY